MTEGPVSGGRIVWITGLSGAGKTTVARLVSRRLREATSAVVLLDGDAVRSVFGDLGHSRAHRIENARRIGRLARLLASQGQTVLCATMSLFRECHEWNRAHLPGYCEVYLRVPMEELVRRDPKGLYRAAHQGRISGVVGVDLPFDEPAAPDLRIDNHSAITAEAAADQITAYLGVAPSDASEVRRLA